ncbi:alpha/beta hydrolase [Alteromonas pelagimontana]|uniref:Alpha/beta hydrolase n=1 Tax=Alteromonas pelagimontana TaxID=1858656 RepID=A0A6M4MC20_9ALTE|nr:alpha/beta hydrolase [Alteromonas pelagimontana]QJR80693.1 alpha/beta hydrolase [Alteromonas pelagimontana]
MKMLISCLTLVYLCLPVLAQEPQTRAVEYDQRLAGYSYPFDVKKFNFQSQGMDVEMAYMFLPPQEGKPVVTLLHGKNFNGEYWQQTADLLQENGYGVLIPDQVGFGKSSKPTDYQYSFAALANNTKALLNSLNISHTIVVGHSMGGMLATRFSLLFADTTDRLVLVNPIGLENYLLYVDYKDVNYFYKSELKKGPEDIIEYQKKNYYDGKWNEDFAEHTTFLVGWINGPDWPLIAKVNALTYDMIFTQPVIEDFRYLKIPTTLILGTRDRTAPGRGWKKDNVSRELGRYDKLGTEVQKLNPDIKLVELEGLGHLPHVEAFDRFKVPFLKAVSGDK